MTDPMKGFTGLTVDLDIQDGEWAKYLHDPFWKRGQITRVGNLSNGTNAGKPAFELMATMDDGTQVILETTWALMRNAVKALEARWPAED